MGFLAVVTFLVPPAAKFQEPELARIIFFHLPAAFACVYFLFSGFWSAYKYLSTREALWDSKSCVAAEIATLMATVTMTTGILFSKVQWGAYWNWDPRQTSFLIVMLIYGAYFAVRSAFDDPVARAKAASVYSMLALLPVMFLIFVYPRLPQVMSLHPNDTIAKGGFSTEYWTVILGIYALLMWFCLIQYKQAIRLTLLEALSDEYNSTSRSNSPVTPVVRPVVLSDED